MTAAIDRTLTDLDQYQAEWAPLTEMPAVATPPELLLTWLERRLTQWDTQLTAAADLASTVEKQLDDRATAVSRWNAVFARWRESLQRMLAPGGTVSG